MKSAPALGIWHARARWRTDLKAQRAARIVLCSQIYDRELLAGLPAGWRARIARELRVTPSTVSRYLKALHDEGAGKPCRLCGCPGHP